MSTWTPAELDTVGNASELSISTRRRDRTLRKAIPIWVVRIGDELYVRSYRGPSGSWYQYAVAQGWAHIRAGSVERDVTVTPADDPTLRPAIDAAYRAKYSAQGASYVTPMVADPAAATTLQLTPAD